MKSPRTWRWAQGGRGAGTEGACGVRRARGYPRLWCRVRTRGTRAVLVPEHGALGAKAALRLGAKVPLRGYPAPRYSKVRHAYLVHVVARYVVALYVVTLYSTLLCGGTLRYVEARLRLYATRCTRLH